MYAKTLVLMTICLLALPSASALSTIGVDVDYDIPLHDGERLEGSVSLYVVPEDDGSVSVWQDTNDCDGIQQNETDACGEPDDRVYPREPEDEHGETCETNHEDQTCCSHDDPEGPSIPEDPEEKHPCEETEEGPSTDPYPTPEHHPATTVHS